MFILQKHIHNDVNYNTFVDINDNDSKTNTDPPNNILFNFPTNDSDAVSEVNSDEILFGNNLNLSNWFIGTFYAILTGFFGGSIGYPYTYTNDTNNGINYLISFAIGVTIIIPITSIWICFCNM